jgi:beta-lactamase superfamily II metal-dependent hydrolase
MVKNKRRKILKFVIVALVFVASVIAFFAIKNADGGFSGGNENPSVKYDYAVSFVDVGEGDCIITKFPDGKVLMVDCGNRDDKIYRKIDEQLKEFGAKKIDYLIITHPDADHVGNALKVAQNYRIENVFLPDIADSMLVFYRQYQEFCSYINELETTIKTNHCYQTIKGENYFLAFLTPTPKGISGSEYIDFNASPSPTEEQSNALCPIIYMEIYGVKFLLTGDAPAKQEKKALENLDLYLNIHYEHEFGKRISLYDVDYLKVSHHGADDASCMEFLTVVCPKNAIISVGGNNNYGHPTNAVLKRLAEVNPHYNLFRTDTDGTILVASLDGQVETITEFSK